MQINRSNLFIFAFIKIFFALMDFYNITIKIFNPARFSRKLMLCNEFLHILVFITDKPTLSILLKTLGYQSVNKFLFQIS